MPCLSLVHDPTRLSHVQSALFGWFWNHCTAGGFEDHGDLALVGLHRLLGRCHWGSDQDLPGEQDLLTLGCFSEVWFGCWGGSFDTAWYYFMSNIFVWCCYSQPMLFSIVCFSTARMTIRRSKDQDEILVQWSL